MIDRHTFDLPRRAQTLLRLVAVSLSLRAFLTTTLLCASASVSAAEASPPRISTSDVESEETRIITRHRGSHSPLRVIRTRGLRAETVIEELQADPEIEFAQIDRRRHRHAVPNDPIFFDQWYLQAAEPAATGASIAWDTTTGSTGTIVAVLDSGVRFDHPDLARASQNGKLLPGYDFVSADGGAGQALTANDGDGRDADPTDPGDWVDSNDLQKPLFANCDIENSSWHGTRVSGLIGASTNNGVGIAGLGWQTWILPVRVLGKCGGYDSDILDAMRWAAGLHVSGVPDNPYPANIINLSLGSDDVCTPAYISVIQEITARGVVIVASAGNGGGPVETPANCPGIVAVAGLRHAGTKVGYSSLGPEVALAAPAGNCVNTSGACLYSLHTTVDTGRTFPGGPGYTDQFATNLGTSFSAPLVAGVGALMHSVNARLAPQHMIARLKESARPFPTGGVAPPPTCHVPVSGNDVQLAECVCTTATCGAGMLYAPNAIVAALRPIADIVAPSSVTPGALLTIDGSSSAAACGRTIASYQWDVTSFSGASPPVPLNPTQPTTQISAPASGSYTLRLTIVDDRGSQDTGTIVVTSASATQNTTPPLAGPACPTAIAPPPNAPTPTPAPPQPSPVSSGGGGGGGGIGAGLLFGLCCVLFALLNYRRSDVSPNSN